MFWNRHERFTRIVEGIVTTHIERIEKELKDLDNAPKLKEAVLKLKEQIADLEINKAKKQEEFDRKDREIEHKIGLLKLQQDVEYANKEAEFKIKMREENLKNQQAQFDEKMKFQNERFVAETGYLKDLMGQILKRLPDITANIEVTGKR